MSYKQIIEEELSKQIGKPITIEYERTRNQFDRILNKWALRSIFIRAEQGTRKYDRVTKTFDRLWLVGIFNHETHEWQEWAYNDVDQEQLFNKVFFNFRDLSERKRLLKQLRQLMETQENHTLPVMEK